MMPDTVVPITEYLLQSPVSFPSTLIMGVPGLWKVSILFGDDGVAQNTNTLYFIVTQTGRRHQVICGLHDARGVQT